MGDFMVFNSHFYRLASGLPYSLAVYLPPAVCCLYQAFKRHLRRHFEISPITVYLRREYGQYETAVLSGKVEMWKKRKSGEKILSG